MEERPRAELGWWQCGNGELMCIRPFVPVRHIYPSIYVLSPHNNSSLVSSMCQTHGNALEHLHEVSPDPPEALWTGYYPYCHF